MENTASLSTKVCLWEEEGGSKEKNRGKRQRLIICTQDAEGPQSDFREKDTIRIQRGSEWNNSVWSSILTEDAVKNIL